ncbi:MAG: ABC transporter ATP-binding protein/permease [Clostridiales bacterium]|jgi:ATP-binding cassette subfamily B protein|nr:ABC transporter ATP-binding protein/permease [Clostridiales bacterium]
MQKKRANEKQESGLAALLSFGGDCKGEIIASVLLAVAGVAAGMAPYYAVSRIILRLFAGEAEFSDVLPWALAALVGYTAYVVCNSVSTLLSHISAFAILKNIREAVAAKLQRAPMGAVLDTPSGKYKNIIVDAVEKLEKLLAHMIPEITSNVLIPIAVIAYLFALDWRMALLALVTIPVGVFAYMGMMKDYIPRMKKYEVANHHMNATIVEYVNGIEVIKAFSQSAQSYGAFTAAVADFRDSTLEWWRNCWLYMAMALSILPSVLIVILPAGGMFYRAGSIDAPTLITCIILSMGISGPLIKVISFTDNFAMIDSVMREIGALLVMPELTRPEKEVELAGESEALAGESGVLAGESFEFVDVRFAYHEKEVLRGVSFATKPGQVTAIVGPSGSGKTTVARLMAGFWDATGGCVRFGGVDLRKIPMAQFTRYVSYVSQDNFLFNISIMENIRLGKPGASDGAVIEAAKAANCHDFIMMLENQYNTLAGDAGGALSGGERQRIAIARAILKDAPVIILDEATAYSDPESEEKIQESLSKLAHGKTMVVIAHRLSTIVNVGQILVMVDGRIESAGTHADLLESSPVYAELWKNYSELAETEVA